MDEALTGIGAGLGAIMVALLGYLGKQKLSSKKADQCLTVRLAPEDQALMRRQAESNERMAEAIDKLTSTFEAHRLEMARFMGLMEGRGAVGD